MAGSGMNRTIKEIKCLDLTRIEEKRVNKYDWILHEPNNLENKNERF